MSSADRWSPIGASPNWLRTWPQRYAFAVIAVAVATAVRYGLVITVGPLPPFVIFVPTIVVVVLLAGFGAGVLATFLSALSVASFFWNSLNVFGTNRPREIVGLCLFCGIGTGASWLAELYRRRESRLREFERVVEGLEEGIIVLDRDYRYLLVNRAFEGYRGMEKEQILGRSVADFMDKELFSTSVQPKLDQCFQGKAVRYEKRYKYPALGERDFSVSYFPIESPRGIERVGCILQDITERKRTEAALREGEDRYRDLVEHSEDLLCTHDLEGRLLTVNAAPARILGYTVEELLQIPMRDLIIPEGRELFDQYLERLRTTGQPEKGLLCVITKSGEVRTWEYNNTLRTEGVPTPVVRGMAHDITERRRAELALRANEEHFRILVEQASDGIAIADASGRWIDVNSAWVEMVGYSRDEMLNQKVGDNIVEGRERLLGELAHLQKGEMVRGEWVIRRKDGTVYPCEESGKRLPDGRFQIIARDITERKRGEEVLRHSEQRYRMLFEENIAGVAISSLDGNILDCNPAWAHMLGYDSPDEIRGRQTSEFYFDPSEQAPLMQELERTGSLLGGEIRMRRKGGTAVWVLFNCSVRPASDGSLVVQATAIDITRRKGAEESLRRSEERFRVALKDSPITVFNQDRNLRYTWIYNSQLYWQKEILGKTDEEIIGPKKAAPLNELKRSVLNSGKAVREEVAIAHNGKSYVFDMTIEPLFDAEHKVIGITAACVDVARLRELADSLQSAKDKLVQEKSYLEKEIEADLGFEEIIGQSSSLREVLKEARIVAPTDSTVLLLGETGTGKELVARSIHSLSGRRDKTFVKLNCAAVPSGLLESELFGHEKGAFTGAVNQKVGRIELADKGTLFLDEIGELPAELQPKLLRVLQDREFERLGGVQTLRVDVRIVSATNRDLRQDVADKKFREDLFYRLNVFPIELPALRERREDIPILVRHFLQKHAARMGKHIDLIPDDAMRVLCNWSWPGNVRELENMIERMVILTKGSVLASPPVEVEDAEYFDEDNLTEMEREHIIRILRETNGVLSGSEGAASRLGIKRTTLQSMMKRLGIEAHEYRRGTGTFGRQ